MIDKLPLVELYIAPIVYCSGLASAEIIGTEIHHIFYQIQRDGADAGAAIVRVVNLHLIMPLAHSRQDTPMATAAFGVPLFG